MAHYKTMAIIGAASQAGKTIAHKMVNDYQLLLMDNVASELTSWANQLQGLYKDAIIHQVDCCKEASWEADVIVLALADSQLISVVEKIKEVSTRKVVVHIADGSLPFIYVQALLPFAKVIVMREDEIADHSIDMHFAIETTQAAGDNQLQKFGEERGTVSA